MRKTLKSIAASAFAALIIGVVLTASGCAPTESVNENLNADADSIINENVGEGMGNTDQGVKAFEIVSTNFEFNVKEIRVNQGDTVTVTLINNEGLHDWVLDEFNVKTAQINEGETASVTFVADKTGTFEYYCSVGEHRSLGMVGNLIVEMVETETEKEETEEVAETE